MGNPPKRWRFLNSGSGNAFFNMAVDEAVAREVASGSSVPTVRVFGWSPPAVSFGYAQRVAREVDLEKCRRMGVGVVRRPSGGRAVLHWNELTYSVLCPEEDPILGGSIQDSYRKISLCLVDGLRSLGLEVEFEPGRQASVSPRGKTLTAPCFSSTSQYEVTLRGRKMIGSAQRRLEGALLQHGSLLMGPQHKRIVDLLPAGREAFRDRFAIELDAHTISLEEAAGRIYAFDEVAEAIRGGFLGTMAGALEDGGLSPEERSLADDLMLGKYAADAWNLGAPEGTGGGAAVPAANAASGL